MLSRQITYHEYKDIKARADKTVDALSKQLQKIPTNKIGLVSEKIRLSPEYQELRLQFKQAFKQSQSINKLGNKTFKKELRADRIAKRNRWKNKQGEVNNE